jgi:uncharacterized protein YjbJ (UPF0337 family)
MDANILKGKWLQLKGSVREKWGQLTDDDVDQVSGSAERLVGMIQERYGYAKQRAEDEVDAWLARYGTTTTP